MWRRCAGGIPRQLPEGLDVHVLYELPGLQRRSPQGRRNQYDIFPIKDYIRGQRVLFLDGESDQVIIRAGKKELCGRWIEHFEPDSLWAKPSVKP